MTTLPDYHYTLARLQLRELNRRELKRNEDRLFYELVKQTDALLDELRQYAKAGYKPDQPRVPAGNPDGGQWTRGGGSGDVEPIRELSEYEYISHDAEGNERIVYDPPIEPVYFLEEAAALVGGATALLNGVRVGVGTLFGEREVIRWSLGKHKSAIKWANRMKNRGWTENQIDEVLAKGKKFSAPNLVNPANSATRYVDLKTGRFVVRDDMSGEILQISGEGYNPLIK